MLFRLFFIAVFLLSCGAFSAAAEEPPPALKRGINLAGWLANAARQPLDERDFRQVSAAGFDHIRLPVNPEFFGFRPDENTDALATINFAPVDKAITLAAQNHLAVVLDIHSGGTFRDTLEENEWAEKEFIDLWSYLAKHYNEKDYPPGSLVFELLNEPHYYHHEKRYAELAVKLVAAIRRISPQRTIIVGAPHGSSIEGLQLIQPIDDAHIIYAFHFYEPFMITHQGIHRGFEKKMLGYFHDVPYPSDLIDQKAVFYAPRAINPPQAQYELDQYVQEKWSADHIAKRMREARDWATEHKAQIICGEFGVVRNNIDPQSRYRWMNDARKAMEANDIGWELWDYTDLMGIAQLRGAVSQPDPIDGSVRLLDPIKGSRIFEKEALEALGLNKSAP